MQSHRTTRRTMLAFTLVELLVALTVGGVLMIGISATLFTAWRSFWGVQSQIRVDSEARRVTDMICEDIRLGGSGVDANNTPGIAREVLDGCTVNTLHLRNGVANGTASYALNTVNGIQVLTRQDNGFAANSPYSNVVVSRNISDVHFEYEYRLRSSNGSWTYLRTTAPFPFSSSASNYNELSTRIQAIYVRVTASDTPFGALGPTYTRTLRSSARLGNVMNNWPPPGE